MILTYRCLELWNVQITFFHDITSLPPTMKMTMNVAAITLPTIEYSTLQPSPFFSTFLLFIFSTFFLSPFFWFVFEYLCFLFLCYFLQFLYCPLCIHFSSNTIILRKHMTSCNKRKRLTMVTLFVFVHQFPACLFCFLSYLSSFN